MRITRDNVEALLSALERLENASDLKDACESWLEGQDEEPKTEDVRDTIRDARDEIEGGIADLEGAVADAAAALGMKIA